MTQPTNLIGQTLGQYQILEKVGQGGMATVYKAWQPSLQRYVAIKVLHHQLNNEEFIQRFRQEAIVAANLSHHNIVRVYEVGQQGENLFIVMQYIEGRSLSEVILQDGPLPMDRILGLLDQIAAALDYAHQRNFVHRDIKPSNILVTDDDWVVITDFGIAKALEGSGATMSLTAAGTIVGTPSYMSPEQITGALVDYRTDLYSFGIVCYEMLGGRPPFGRTTTAAILYAQVNAPAPSIRELNQEVPRHVESALERMLAKKPDDRFLTAEAFVESLNSSPAHVTQKRPRSREVALAGRPSSQRRRVRATSTVILSLAVLAVVLGLGILIAIVFINAGSSADLDELVAQGNNALAAGDYATAEHVFAQVLAEEPDLAVANRGLADALRGQGRYGESIPHYEAALATDENMADSHAGLGWAYFERGEYKQAISAFTRVIALRPAEATGYEGKAKSYLALEAYEEAVEPLQIWAEMEPDAVDPHRILGQVYHAQGLYDKAIKHLRQAAALSNSGPEIYRRLVDSYRALEQFEEALAIAEEWVEAEPENADAWQALGWSLHNLQRYDEAVAAFQMAIDIEEKVRSYQGLGDSYYQLGQYPLALEAFQRQAELDSQSSGAHSSLGWTLNRLERYEEAIEAFLTAIDLAPEPSASLYLGLGDSYFKLGDYPSALEAFRRRAELDPQSSGAYSSLGWTLNRLERYEEAIDAFLTAIDLAPEPNASLYQGLGDSYFGIKAYEESRDAFQQWVRLEPNKAAAHSSLGWAYLMLKDCPSATDSFRRALEIAPDLTTAQDGLKRCNQ